MADTNTCVMIQQGIKSCCALAYHADLDRSRWCEYCRQRAAECEATDVIAAEELRRDADWLLAHPDKVLDSKYHDAGRALNLADEFRRRLLNANAELAAAEQLATRQDELEAACRTGVPTDYYLMSRTAANANAELWRERAEAAEQRAEQAERERDAVNADSFVPAENVPCRLVCCGGEGGEEIPCALCGHGHVESSGSATCYLRREETYAAEADRLRAALESIARIECARFERARKEKIPCERLAAWPCTSCQARAALAAGAPDAPKGEA